jgi:RNA polymerase sigma-70 factor (ECF subfamily)
MRRGDESSAVRALADELVAVRCQLGERAAFDLLLERWHGPLAAYVARLAGDDEAAREVVQDTWLRVLRGIGRLNDPAKIGAWLFGIARRALMDRLRAQYGALPSSGAEVDSLATDEDEHDTARELDLCDDVAALRTELAELPFAEREVLTLFYLGELPLAEVAAVLEVPQGTVKSRLFRARNMLARALERGASAQRARGITGDDR